MSDADLIRALGGIRPVARRLGHRNHTTVQGWVDRNHIPDPHREAVKSLVLEEAA